MMVKKINYVSNDLVHVIQFLKNYIKYVLSLCIIKMNKIIVENINSY